MKQITLLQGKALLIELPEGATDPEIYGRSLTYDTPDVDEWGYDYQAVKLPEGNWQIVGMLSEVTEEQAAGLVDKTDTHPHAVESLDSGIRAEGYTFSNIEVNPDDFKAGTFSSGEHQRLRDRFEAAQSRVLDRGRCLLLGREG